MDHLLTDAIESLCADHAPPAVVRVVEAGGSSAELWGHIRRSGFADALVPEDKGGSGLTLPEAFGVLLACGRSAVPVPLGLTLPLRAILAAAGCAVPDGPLTIAPATTHGEGGAIACARVPFGRTAEWVLADGHRLLPVDQATVIPTGVRGCLDADLRWDKYPAAALDMPTPVDGLALGAAITAALMAGAMERVLADTVRHANDRRQFGKPIGRFQAVQQQISVMAEQVFAARMAAELGCQSAGFLPDPLRAGLAKSRAGAAAVTVTAVAHAVHGAMGIAEECDLQIFTRGLHTWRAAFGTEAYWHRRLGEAFLAGASTDSLAFVRERLS